MRNLLHRTLNAAGGEKAGRTAAILGYSPADLRAALEAQLPPGMSWENRDDWHIDHIVPVSHFIARGITDPAIINALDNLRPVWAADNMAKAGQYFPGFTEAGLIW